MFSYYILPTGYLIVLFAFSLLKPIRFVVTMYEFQGLMIKSVVLAIFGLFSQHSILTQFYGIWFRVCKTKRLVATEFYFRSNLHCDLGWCRQSLDEIIGNVVILKSSLIFHKLLFILW